jgi:hypothetical protein
MNSLFGQLETAMATSKMVDIRISYSSTYGYPESVYIVFAKLIAGEELGFSVLRLESAQHQEDLDAAESQLGGQFRPFGNLPMLLQQLQQYGQEYRMDDPVWSGHACIFGLNWHGMPWHSQGRILSSFGTCLHVLIMMADDLSSTDTVTAGGSYHDFSKSSTVTFI